MEYGSIALGSAAILAMILAPGIALAYALFPKRDELSLVERIGVSFVLGLVPTLVLYALEKNLSLPITTTTSLAVIVLTTAAGVGAYNIRKK